MANLRPRALRVRESTGQRCTETWLDPHGAYRCRLDSQHRRRYPVVECERGAYADGVCMRRQTNHTARTTRFCALPSDHDGACVYLFLTERPATSDELGVSIGDGPARMIVFTPRDVVITY